MIVFLVLIPVAGLAVLDGCLARWTWEIEIDWHRDG